MLGDDARAGRGCCLGARAFDPPEEPMGRTTGEVGVAALCRPAYCGSAAQGSARPLLLCCLPRPGFLCVIAVIMTAGWVRVSKTDVINHEKQ